jgi:ribosomal protein S19
MYLIKANPFKHALEKKIYNRSCTIPKMYIGREVFIYSGKRWHTKIINKWMVGFKFGELTWNRRLALYKAKQLRKKNKKNKIK